MQTYQEYKNGREVCEVRDGVAECDVVEVIDFNLLDTGRCPKCSGLLHTWHHNGILEEASCTCCGIDWSSEI